MWGVLEGPLVLCEDLALPASFAVASQQLGSRFELVDRRPGDGPRLAPEAQVEDRAPVRVEHRSWEPPFLVDPDGPGLAAEFPVPEAHQAALDGSGSYAELFGEPGEALVVDTNVIQSGRRDTGVDEVGRSSETYNRSLTAVGEDGSAVQVWVEKTYETVRVGPENVTLENADVTGDRELEFPDHPTVDTAEPRQATVASALDLGDRLVDTSPQILVQEATVDDVSRSAGDELGREDGHALQLWLEDPQPESGNLPPGITAPYGVRVDGPTGDLLQVDVPAGELPLRSRTFGDAGTRLCRCRSTNRPSSETGHAGSRRHSSSLGVVGTVASVRRASERSGSVRPVARRPVGPRARERARGGRAVGPPGWSHAAGGRPRPSARASPRGCRRGSARA
jgi:hypothetical protein